MYSISVAEQCLLLNDTVSPRWNELGQSSDPYLGFIFALILLRALREHLKPMSRQSLLATALYASMQSAPIMASHARFMISGRLIFRVVCMCGGCWPFPNRKSYISDWLCQSPVYGRYTAASGEITDDEVHVKQSFPLKLAKCLCKMAQRGLL